MTFEHKDSTRNPMNWIIAPIAIVFGAFIALGLGGIITGDGFEWGNLLAYVVGFAFLAVGLMCIYGIIFPKEYTTIISNEMIICKTNDDITYQVKKNDIKMISICTGDMDIVNVEMKSSEISSFPFTGMMNLSTFREELIMYDYPVDDVGG